MIDVLLATYQGERFLREQLESLFEQTNQDFRILVRDDASTDSTQEVVRSFASRFPERVFLAVNQVRLGAVGNFSALLADSTAEYAMFCDQDDLWLPQKIETNLASMRELETRHGNTPLLVYSDLKVVSADLTVISDSFWMGMRRPGVPTFASLLAANRVTGCTAMMNHALVRRAVPVPVKDVFMHDWWVALVASAFGALQQIEEPLVLYRQHEHNAIGARKTHTNMGQKVIRAIREIGRNPVIQENLRTSSRQARAFEARFGTEIAPKFLGALRAAGALPQMGPLERRWAMLHYGLVRPSLKSNINLLLGA